jgi:hypothetical protein
MSDYKICSVCKENKSITEFYQRSNRPSREERCKTCRYNCSTYKSALKHRLKKLYKLSLEVYESMLEEQDYKCYICGDMVNEYLCVDHDHKTGNIRKLLCRPCNSGLGLLKDNPELLRRAASYIEEHRGE